MEKEINQHADEEVKDLQSKKSLHAEAKSKALRRISYCLTAIAVAYIVPKFIVMHIGFIEGCVECVLNKRTKVQD